MTKHCKQMIVDLTFESTVEELSEKYTLVDHCVELPDLGRWIYVENARTKLLHCRKLVHSCELDSLIDFLRDNPSVKFEVIEGDSEIVNKLKSALDRTLVGIELNIPESDMFKLGSVELTQDIQDGTSRCKYYILKFPQNPNLGAWNLKYSIGDGGTIKTEIAKYYCGQINSEELSPTRKMYEATVEQLKAHQIAYKEIRQYSTGETDTITNN